MPNSSGSTPNSGLRMMLSCLTSGALILEAQSHRVNLHCPVNCSCSIALAVVSACAVCMMRFFFGVA